GSGSKLPPAPRQHPRTPLPIGNQMLLRPAPASAPPAGQHRLDGLCRSSGRRQPPAGIFTPSIILSPDRPVSVHLGKAGRPARAKLARRRPRDVTPLS